MAIELPDPYTTVTSADGTTLRAPRWLAATWDLPSGSRTSFGVFLPFPAFVLQLAINLLTSCPLSISVDAKTARALIALEAYGVPVLSALLDAPLPRDVSYTLEAIHTAMADKSAPRQRRHHVPAIPPPLPAWCRAVLEERAPHVLVAL
jgi:hypothetical protein